MLRSTSKSETLFRRAEAVIPGGVNSPVRAFTHVGGSPVFIGKGDGAYIFDVDGNSYIDYIGSWGPLIFGHAPAFVSEIVSSVARRGTSFGTPTEIEVRFAEKLTQLIPALEMVRCVSSGTEATMSAIRLARACTGRKRLIKFNGCYHGHSDSLLVKAGSGVATHGIPGSPGVPEEIAGLTSSIEYNDLELLKETIAKLGEETIAGIIIEPVAGNMGLILPNPGYLEGIRELCTKYGIVFIIDEVMTGFRVSLGGAHSVYAIEPDLLCFGKVIGGGLPIGAFGGKRSLMKKLSPSGNVYQAGTLSGNPLALSVGIETLNRLELETPFLELQERGEQLVSGMIEIGRRLGIPISATSIGSMFGFFFSEKLPSNYTEVSNSNIELFKRFFHQMLKRGVYLAPSPFEAGFISVAHTMDLVDLTLKKAKESLEEIL